MAYNTPAKLKAYIRKNKVRNRIRRRKYFKEYNRKNKDRRKMMYMLEGMDKIMVSTKMLSQDIIDKTELMRKENLKLELEINQIKNFINIK